MLLRFFTTSLCGVTIVKMHAAAGDIGRVWPSPSGLDSGSPVDGLVPDEQAAVDHLVALLPAHQSVHDLLGGGGGGGALVPLAEGDALQRVLVGRKRTNIGWEDTFLQTIFFWGGGGAAVKSSHSSIYPGSTAPRVGPPNQYWVVVVSQGCFFLHHLCNHSVSTPGQVSGILKKEKPPCRATRH